MTKQAHEEEWRHHGGDHVLVGDGYIRATTYGAGREGATTEDAARLISAAPDMARALLEVREAMEDDVMDTRVLGGLVTAALRKAGVLQ